MSDRYSRQQLFAPIGHDGQAKLRAATVLIIGCGALGTGNAEAFVRAGVGRVIIIDRDYVEWSNLQRQTLFGEKEAQQRMPKAIAAKERLEAINRDVTIEAHIVDGTAAVLEPLLLRADLTIDATDNFETRLVLNDLAMKHHKPWIFGACVGSYGMSYTVLPHVTPCFHCLVGAIPMGAPTCDTAGIIAPAVQMVVSHQVAEGLKVLVGATEALRGKLVTFDVWENRYQTMNVNSLKKATCPSCSTEATHPFLQYEETTKTAVLCGRDAVQIRPARSFVLSLDTLADRLSEQVTVQRNDYLLAFQAGEQRVVVFRDGRALIHGTKSVEEAKTIYHRWIGG